MLSISHRTCTGSVYVVPELEPGNGQQLPALYAVVERIFCSELRDPLFSHESMGITIERRLSVAEIPSRYAFTPASLFIAFNAFVLGSRESKHRP
jgi:hypothetical protein